LEEIGNKEIEEGSIKGIIMEGEIVSKEWMKEIGEEIGMIDLLIVIGLIRDLITIHEIEIITEIGIMIISNLIIKKGQGKKEEMMMFKLII
jgi:glutamine synthetase type III